LVIGQKNGVVHGLDPENKGAIVWQRKIGLGGYAGGIHWGMATDGKTVYAPNADTDFIGRFDTERFPGMFALDAQTGKQLWYTRAHLPAMRVFPLPRRRFPAWYSPALLMVSCGPTTVTLAKYCGAIRPIDRSPQLQGVRPMAVL
jgi:hypothetical protein